MILACQKLLGQITKVLGLRRTLPPVWEKLPNKPIFFLKCSLIEHLIWSVEIYQPAQRSPCSPESAGWSPPWSWTKIWMRPKTDILTSVQSSLPNFSNPSSAARLQGVNISSKYVNFLKLNFLNWKVLQKISHMKSHFKRERYSHSGHLLHPRGGACLFHLLFVFCIWEMIITAI